MSTIVYGIIIFEEQAKVEVEETSAVTPTNKVGSGTIDLDINDLSVKSIIYDNDNITEDPDFLKQIGIS